MRKSSRCSGFPLTLQISVLARIPRRFKVHIECYVVTSGLRQPRFSCYYSYCGNLKLPQSYDDDARNCRRLGATDCFSLPCQIMVLLLRKFFCFTSTIRFRNQSDSYDLHRVCHRPVNVSHKSVLQAQLYNLTATTRKVCKFLLHYPLGPGSLRGRLIL